MPNTINDPDKKAAPEKVTRSKAEIDREYNKQIKGNFTDNMTPVQWTVMIVTTAVMCILFIIAAYFSWTLQESGDSGIGQTFFLAAMAIGFFVVDIREIRRRILRKRKEREEQEEG